MDSKIEIIDKDAIIDISEKAEDITLKNSKVMIICKDSDKTIKIKSEGNSELYLFTKDSKLNINIKVKGKLKVIGKTISEKELELNIKVKDNENDVDVKIDSLNKSRTRVIGILDVTHEKTRSNLALDCLSLTEMSKAQLIPILEVKNNDVEVKHSALAHKISEEEIFYLKSKGIEKDAEKMIIKSYLLRNIEGFKEEFENQINL